MARDIDKIIELVRIRIPEVVVVQMPKFHPADDDNLWWFRLPDQEKDIHIERGTPNGADGACPFIVESWDDKNGDGRIGNTVEETVEMIHEYLQLLRV